MIIGVPGEIKANENRVALQPVGAEMLGKHGHKVLIQKNAGAGSGFADELYQKAGAEICATAAEVFAKSEMIIKVKEPLAQEYSLIKKDQILFTYFHFAASEELTRAMMKSGAACIAYETIQKADGSLPLLVPMSEVAGRMATQEGAKYLERALGGRGLLLGGVPGVAPGEVVILVPDPTPTPAPGATPTPPRSVLRAALASTAAVLALYSHYLALLALAPTAVPLLLWSRSGRRSRRLTEDG